MKSLAPKGSGKSSDNKMDEPTSDGGRSRNCGVDCLGEKPSTATQASTSDQNARLYRKGAQRGEAAFHWPCA